MKTKAERLQDIQLDLQHIKHRIDIICAIAQKIEKDGLKVKQ